MFSGGVHCHHRYWLLAVAPLILVFRSRSTAVLRCETLLAIRRTNVRRTPPMSAVGIAAMLDAGNLDGVLVLGIEEHPVVATAEPQAGQRRLELFHVAVAVGQVAVHTVEN